MNNREIKFRAWDKELKFMYELGRLEMPWPYKNIPIMQFTGLLDRQGKEICEGDIVAVKSYYIGDSLIKEACGEVKFGNGAFYINYEFSPELCEEEIENEHIQVIGNIYENPELLEA